MEILEKKIKFEDTDMLMLLGHNDKYLHIIENKFQSTITVRGNTLILRGEAIELKTIENVFQELAYILKRNSSITAKDVVTVLDFIEIDTNPNISYYSHESDKENSSNLNLDSVIYHGIRHPVSARNEKQLEYFGKVQKSDLVFAIGPAGTGKTYLAVAMALAALRRGDASRIILSRPAVEAGESLGFLPGDLREKLDPYIRPLMDALFDMLPADKLKSLMEKNIIEIIPLAYMRGRTLSHSFIILDEAQNATRTQMKMFLTRLGEKSKAIITGDVTQIDLVNKSDSGLINARNILNQIPNIEFVYFENKDVMRHRLVAEIIRAYEAESQNKHD